MSSLFNHDSDWRIGVIRYRGAYFIHVFHTETELSIEFGQTPLEKRMCYWGHKFEDYLCSGISFLSLLHYSPCLRSLETPALYPSPKKLFSLVNLATLGVHQLLYGSEIDACTRDSTLTDEQQPNGKQKKKRTFVEIKVVYAQNMLDLHTTT